MANNIEEFESTDLVTMANVNERINATDVALQALSQTVASGVKIATGSYTGTGTYGASNPNTLTFDFEPKLLIISGPNAANGKGVGRSRAIFFDNFPVGESINYLTGSNASYIIITEWGRTIKWYSGTDAGAQLNAAPSSGYESVSVYRYLAIG